MVIVLTDQGREIARDNKSGLYRQCAGALKSGNGAKALSGRRIVDTACCTEPAMGIQS